MNWNFNPQPQSRAEFVKNEKRIKDLVAKCGGDKQKEINKAFEMAAKITTPEKAYNRGHVAREMGYEHIFEVFYQKAYELGSVSVAEHRDHQIEKILNDDIVDYVIPQKKEKKQALLLSECFDLKNYDYNDFQDIPGEEVPDFLIESITEILKLTCKSDFDLSDEDEKDDYERLLKRLTIKKIEKSIRDGEGAWFGLTKNEHFEKMYWFQMDSDSLRYATEIHLNEDGTKYIKI